MIAELIYSDNSCEYRYVIILFSISIWCIGLAGYFEFAKKRPIINVSFLHCRRIVSELLLTVLSYCFNFSVYPEKGTLSRFA